MGEFVDFLARAMVGDAGKDVDEPFLRIDAFELGGDDQRVHDSGAFTATVEAGEESQDFLPWLDFSASIPHSGEC
jgi:hypothetical protein